VSFVPLWFDIFISNSLYLSVSKCSSLSFYEPARHNAAAAAYKGNTKNVKKYGGNPPYFR
jgi:hypothetical protein